MQMINYPKISIVVPSLNQGAYLEETISSIISQNYPNMEILLLDGGSSDNSLEVIQKYSENIAFWRSHPDKGQTLTLIEGFQRASGEIMGWINSDDVLLPGSLNKIANAFVSSSGIGLIGGNFILIDENSNIIRCKRHLPNAAFFAKHGLFLVNQPGSFFSRNDYEKVGGLDPNLDLVMDTDLYIRMLTSGTKYEYIDDWLSGFRIHSKSKTQSEPDRTRKEHKHAQMTWNISRFPFLWRYIYYCFQIINGNYLKCLIDTRKANGMNWRYWASTYISQK